MDLQRINYLIGRYEVGSASEAEIEELNQWYRQTAYQDAEFPEDENLVGEAMRQQVLAKAKAAPVKFPYFKWVAAASIIVILGITGLLLPKLTGNQNSGQQIAQSNIIPGGNKAVLTLGNGTKLSLTDAGNGQIASQNGIKITKTAAGQLIYEMARETENTPASGNVDAFNTIETPKGGQYQVVLPDGSKVWLNAFSAIKFPVNFSSKKERRVELTGEAYFEVAHNPQLPFRVVSAAQTIEVLGTHFNVNAYADDESTKTTLLEGAVRLNAGSASAMLIPGQQARLTNKFIVSEVNTEEAVAWKNGYFNFDDEKLDAIMKSIARWYNVDVVFEDQSLKNETFGAVTTRFASITKLLNMMEQTGDARFAITGNTITVSKKK